MRQKVAAFGPRRLIWEPQGPYMSKVGAASTWVLPKGRCTSRLSGARLRRGDHGQKSRYPFCQLQIVQRSLNSCHGNRSMEQDVPAATEMSGVSLRVTPNRRSVRKNFC